MLVSAYPPGGHYRTHCDSNSRGHNARQLTCLLYCNPGWDSAKDGGDLRLHVYEPEEEVDVPPVDGCLVLFEAARVYHSVQESKKLRFAVTLWLWEANGDE